MREGRLRSNRVRRPARGDTAQDPGRRLLVVCEGKCTEPDYINGYKQHVRNPTVKVVLAHERGDPRRVVEIAKERKAAAAAEAKRRADPFLDFDEVWCVFDRDDHERFADARTMARDNHFELAVSNPCFELWLLLHFRESPGERHRDDVKQLLCEFLPKYDKKLDFGPLAPGVENANRRAQSLDRDAERMGEAGRNPTTGVYRLMRSIARRGA